MTRNRSWQLVLFFGVALGSTLLVFVVVGVWAGSHAFAWDPGAVAATAWGLATLAGATGWLGYSTAGDVRATQKLA